MNKALVALLLCVGLSVGCGVKEESRTLESVPGELIVKVDKPYGNRVMSEIASLLGTQVLDIKEFKTDSSLFKLKLNGTSKVEVVQQELAKIQGVQSSTLNYIVRALGTPDDPSLGKLWGLKNTGQADSAGQVGFPGADINITPLWEKGITGSKEVVVAVIDTGVDWEHPDLKENIYVNPGEIPGNNVDDDKNGFVDDIHGWNFSGKNANSSDDNGHGTHCSGTIGGVGNNGVGIVGVNWQVRIMPLKFLSAEGSGTTEDAIEAINYATMMKVDVMSNSWGGGGAEANLEDAIKKAGLAGITFVAAAGNDSSNNDTVGNYPSNYNLPNVIAVAATDNRDKLASFSNWGKTKVHVAAPGVKIYSSTPAGNYASYSGTSMATPHVAGIVALMKSVDASLSPLEIRNRLIKTSKRIGSLKTKSQSKGRVDACAAVENRPPTVDEPNENDWTVEEKVIESAHPYALSKVYSFNLKVDGAKFIRVKFNKVDTETKYDKVEIIDPKDGSVLEELSGKHTDYVTDYVEGSELLIKLTSDNSVPGWGFKVSEVHTIK